MTSRQIHRWTFQFIAAHAVQVRCGLGRSRRFLVVVDLMLSGWTVAVALFSRTLPLAMVARVIGILGLVSTGFSDVHLVHFQPL
jgi:hypothetical protein